MEEMEERCRLQPLTRVHMNMHFAATCWLVLASRIDLLLFCRSVEAASTDSCKTFGFEGKPMKSSSVAYSC